MHDISIPYWLIVDTKDFKMYALDSYMHISPNLKKKKILTPVTADPFKRKKIFVPIYP